MNNVFNSSASGATLGDGTMGLSFPALIGSPVMATDEMREAHKRVKSAKVMIVDDEPTNVKIVRRLLEMEGYTSFFTLTDSTLAVNAIHREMPDLILLDLMMPRVGGLEILAAVRSDSMIYHIPVIVLTAVMDRETRAHAIELGATDCLVKPVEATEMVPRVRNVLLAKTLHDQLLDHNRDLESLVRDRTAELEASRRDLVLCLARAAEFRDDKTGNHVLRVGKYARLIAEAMKLDQEMIEMVEQAAALHDIGKIGIPDSILLKPGKLSSDEFDVMRKHVGFGKKILAQCSPDEEARLRLHAEFGAKILEVGASPVIDMARTIALTHHEHWDGNGYPLGLKGEDIPLPGRITAVADVFDALSSRRCYKEAFPLDKCLEMMDSERGTHFDPEVLDAFFSVRNRVVAVQIQFADES